MPTESPITLRDVVGHLHQILRLPRKKSAITKLLGLLQAGDLKAGFQFPGGKVYWIPIPTSYWAGVSSHKFRTLRYVPGDENRTGTYEVRIGNFVDDYIQAVSQEISETTTATTSTLLDELKKALPAAQKRYEVAITHEEWTKYLSQHEISSSMLQQRSPAGNREKSGWHHLVPIIASYMMTLNDRPDESRDRKAIAGMVLQIAKLENISYDLPSVPTLADTISKVFTRFEQLSKNPAVRKV
jgi:hypothetical protein